MNNFNGQIYFGAETVVVDGVVVVAGFDVVCDAVCAVIDVMFAVANVDPVICIDCVEDIVMTVDVKQRISE